MERSGELRRIRTFAQVFQYLVDDQGWPFDITDLQDDDLEGVTYDWTPTELGIPVERLPRLRRFQQMRPLTADQPWGVFFLEFDGDRLPRMQVRRLLRALVHRKRTIATSTRTMATSNRTWNLHDLLFVVITGTGDSTELHLVAFQGNYPATAEFRSLSWRPAHSPASHLQRLAGELLPRLKWPDDDSDVEAWRTAWREAFKLRPGQAINDSARLADRMARTARDLRFQITETMKQESSSGPFTSLMSEVRSRLISGAAVSNFADMCAQTLVYGMLSSRVISPEDFGSSPVFSTVPLANPFLEAFFEQVHDQATVLDLPGSDLPQLAADLRETNVEAILDQIGDTAKGGDPVIHFYEEFLKKYDGKMRANAGAFYTPQPAVEFMVRAVDDVLRSCFGLPMGIADASTWQEAAQRGDFEIPEGVDPGKPFVSMIDPATGTGTFLVEWLRRARKSFESVSDQPETWPQHLRDSVLPSMHAFESMLGPYTIAHLKTALEMHSAGTEDAYMQLLLTDTLEHTPLQGQLAMMSDPIAEEGARAAALKDTAERFTVVIGNPPYDREHRAAGDTGKRKGGVIRHGTAGMDPLIRTVTEPMKAAGLGRHLKNVYNDYVYFWRWAVWQATELPPGPGIVAFITASSYLDGVSMGGVRNMLRDAFDELWIIDLGGDSRGALKEDNIFDIKTPVAIAVGVRTGRSSSQVRTGQPSSHVRTGRPSSRECKVHYHKINGSRDEKLDNLKRLRLENISDTVTGSSLDRFTPRSDDQYFDWPEITDLFPWIYSGCQVKRLWPIGETQALLKRRWSDLIGEVPRHRGPLLRETASRTASSRPIALLGGYNRIAPIRDLDMGDAPEGIKRYGYRSFDRQWIIADSRVVDAPKRPLWQVCGARQVFLTTLTSTKLGRGPALSVTPYVPDLHHFSGRGGKDVIPLYRDPHGSVHNVTRGLLSHLSERLSIKVSAEDLFAYVYALCGTPAFTERFIDPLAEAASPIHVPITTDAALFKQAVALGRDLLWQHTWGERFIPTGQGHVTDARRHITDVQASEIIPVEGMPDSFNYDPANRRITVGTGAFAPVSPEVWNFEVSGLRVVRSWLGYRMKRRKGRKSSPLDNIRPSRWNQTPELLRLLSILEHTIGAIHEATALLERIVNDSSISATDLPTPVHAERKPPKL